MSSVQTEQSPGSSPSIQYKQTFAHGASLGLAPEGLPFIGLLGLTALTFAAFGCWPVAVTSLVLTWFSAFFFRDPERVIPTEHNVAISPADGRIVRIERRVAPLTEQETVCVSIFMNVFSVHVNRAPVAGRVVGIRYFKGAFMNAAFDKASTENERCAYHMTDGNDRNWVMVQIAGLIARRIVCRITPDTNLQRGERFGLIRFGSRVDVYLPEGYVPAVRVGEKVFAGESLIARPDAETIS